MKKMLCVNVLHSACNRDVTDLVIVMSLISLHLITFVFDYVTFLRFSLQHTMTDVMSWTEC